MAEVMLKQVRNSPRYGRTITTTAFKIVGKPPHVFSFEKVTEAA
jgi:hypothetical protein